MCNYIYCNVFLTFILSREGDAGTPGNHRFKDFPAPSQDRSKRPFGHHVIYPIHPPWLMYVCLLLSISFFFLYEMSLNYNRFCIYAEFLLHLWNIKKRLLRFCLLSFSWLRNRTGLSYKKQIYNLHPIKREFSFICIVLCCQHIFLFLLEDLLQLLQSCFSGMEKEIVFQTKKK